MKYSALLFLILVIAGRPVVAQFVELPDGPRVSRIDIGRLSVPGQAITVEALVTAGEAESVANIVSKHSNPTNVNYVLRANAFYVATDGTSGVVKNPVTLCRDRVYHVAGTYDGRYIRYYVNGVQVAAAICTGNMVQNSNVTSIGNMQAQNSTYEQFHGFISEVRIWNVARSQADIAANMLDLPNPQQQKGLLAYYKFQGSLVNVQGDSRWNGRATGRAMLGRNPHFSGSVSQVFCGGDAATLKTLQEPSPMVVTPTQPPLVAAQKTQPEPTQPSSPPATVKSSALPAASRPVAKPPDLTKSERPKLPPLPDNPTTDTISLTIRLWDFDGIDGDSIAVQLNGKSLGAKEMRLEAEQRYGSPQSTFAVRISPKDSNILTITSLSEGSLSVTTVGLMIADSVRGQRYYFRLRKGQTVRLNLVVK